MARFSICTAFFNDVVSRVSELYESLLLQQVDWEWVVTDDFSEDPSVREMLLALASEDSRVRYVYQDHKMQFLRNPAPFAKGEFVFHIDSDDLVYPGYLPICQKLFDRFPDVGVILCNGHVVNQRGFFVRYHEHMPTMRRPGVTGDNSASICFLGRCWRRSIEIDFSGIIEDRFFTTTNDFYLVKYLNTKTRMLVVPRNMIRYSLFVDEEENYKPFGSRGIEIDEELSSRQERGFSQFMEYYESNKQPLDGLFPYYESIPKLYMPLYPIHMFDVEKIRFIGFGATECEKMLLEDLYAEKSISWGDSYEEGALNILNSEERIEVDCAYSIMAYFAPMKYENIDHYKIGFQNHGFISQSGNTWLFR